MAVAGSNANYSHAGSLDELCCPWSRFSMIGAALRGGACLHDRSPGVCSPGPQKSPTVMEPPTPPSTTRNRHSFPGLRTVPHPARACVRASQAGASTRRASCGVHLLARTQTVPPVLATTRPTTIVLEPDTTGTVLALNAAPAEGRASNGEPERYVTPAPNSSASIVPPGRLANYVVAHSEYTGPLSRRMALLGLVATDPSEVSAVMDPAVDQPSGQPAVTTEAADAQ